MMSFVNTSAMMIQQGMSHPQIITMNRDGSFKDDYREAYWWIRDNTPEDARILSWWDYGYQLAGLSKRVTVADGNTWNHEHLAFLGLSLTSPVEEAHMIHRHWADYVLIWTESDLAKATHMARIANSVYKGHCYDKLCLQFGWAREGPSDMMSKSFMYAVTQGAGSGIANNPTMTNKYKEVFVSKHGAVRILKVLQVSQKSRRLGSAWETKNCDAEGSWFCPGRYPPALHALREAGFSGFGWTIKGEQAAETKEFTVTTTTTTAVDDEEDEEPGIVGDAKKKKLADELKRYKDLFYTRVQKNLALGPKPNAKLLPKGDYGSSCGGCRMHEPNRRNWYHDIETLGIKKTRLKCTHCETGGYPKMSEIELTTCHDFHEAYQKAGGEQYAYSGWGKDAIMNQIEVENKHGHLYCRPKPHQEDIPEGDYKSTCIACHLSKSTKKHSLKCEHCMKSSGEWSGPVIFRGAKKCMDNGGWIQNQDGKLSCTRDRPLQSMLTFSGLSSWLHSTTKILDRSSS